MDFPDGLSYSAEHEWVAVEGTRARVGITDFAQDALGDIVFVQLPEVGTKVEAGQPFGEVESTKSVSEIYAPVDGTISARNERLDGEPELVNRDPYGDGWILRVDLGDGAGTARDGLLDAAAYRALVTAQPSGA